MAKTSEAQLRASRKWKKANPDRVREKNKEYEAQRPPRERDRTEYMREYQRAYRARKKAEAEQS